MRSYSKRSIPELWLEEYKHPAACELPLPDPGALANQIQEGSGEAYLGYLKDHFLDKIDTGFLVWKHHLKVYLKQNQEIQQWEEESQTTLDIIDKCLTTPELFPQLATLWSQESNRANSSADIRGDNYQFAKMIAKMFGNKHLTVVLPLISGLCMDSDKFKQRGGVELLLGYIRGSKHWDEISRNDLLRWTMEHLPAFYELVKPDTRTLWDSFFHLLMADRDPRRFRPLLDWVFSLHIDFKSDSAFMLSKTLALVTGAAENLGIRFRLHAEEFLSLLFEHSNSPFAEIREQMALSIEVLTQLRWQPGYSCARDFLTACNDTSDPLHIRGVSQLRRIQQFTEELPRLRLERSPPPYVAQSSYDCTSLTLLQLFWIAGHGSYAAVLFPYVVPLIPEIFLMTELSDNAELVKYSTAVLFLLPSIAPPSDFVEPISSSAIHVIKTSQSWRVRQNALLFLLVFFYRNLASFSHVSINHILDVFIDSLKDENLEVRNTAAKVFTGVLRCSQRSQIPDLKERFLAQERAVRLPKKSDANYTEAMLVLHSAILGLCALVDCFPYVVEKWVPPLIEVLARHSADRPPISTTIRNMASDFKKTHQDTWQTDKLAFSEDELQALNTILVGTSYYA